MIPGFALAGLQQAEGDARNDTAYSLSNLYHMYSTRGLPDLINSAASRNIAYSGPTAVAADRQREDVNMQAADLQRALAKRLRDIQQAKMAAQVGQQPYF